MNKSMRNFCKKKLNDANYYTEIDYHNLISPIVILLGPNGTGKSMSIRLMLQQLKSKGDSIRVVSYSTHNDDIVKKCSNPFNFKPEGLVAAFFSEGERMNVSFFDWVHNDLLRAILEDRSKDVYVFIDEADSGLSIDKIYEAFKDIIYIVKEEIKKGRQIHVVITANSYELAEIFDIGTDMASYLWVPTKEYINLGTYEHFKKKYLDYYNEMNKEDSK